MEETTLTKGGATVVDNAQTQVQMVGGAHPTATADGWQAELHLRFARANGTVLVGRGHRGPLRVQKPLYPEGRDICHAVLLHPPGGIAGGDSLEVDIEAGAGAGALITTPGAGKWYRSGGRPAVQTVRIGVGADAAVEWLPQETIFFDGVEARLATHVQLNAQATFIGHETFCLGRIAAGETFRQGRIALSTRIERDGALLWSERGILTGGSPWLEAAAGMAGYPFCATLLAAGPALDRPALEACRALPEIAGTQSGVTLLPGGLLVARCLARQAEPAREWFLALWSVLRPALLNRPAIVPRVWNT